MLKGGAIEARSTSSVILWFANSLIEREHFRSRRSESSLRVFASAAQKWPILLCINSPTRLHGESGSSELRRNKQPFTVTTAVTP